MTQHKPVATAAALAGAIHAAMPALSEATVSADTKAMANHLYHRLVASAGVWGEKVAAVTIDLPAAAAEMLDLFQDALSSHVYAMDDGETPPIDCPMVASIQRMRNALDLPPMLTPWADAVPVQDGAALPLPRVITMEDLAPAARADAERAFALIADTMRYTSTGIEYLRDGVALRDPFTPAENSRARDLMAADNHGGPRAPVWGAAAPGVHWLNQDQAAAKERGWMLTLNGNGQIDVLARPNSVQYVGLGRDTRAAAHVFAIAETPLPPYPASDPRVTYRDLCQRAVAIVNATAAGREG